MGKNLMPGNFSRKRESGSPLSLLLGPLPSRGKSRSSRSLGTLIRKGIPRNLLTNYYIRRLRLTMKLAEIGKRTNDSCCVPKCWWLLVITEPYVQSETRRDMAKLVQGIIIHVAFGLNDVRA
ncbi:hypothetical protein ACS0TY_033947 [Phlomoides rotata]